MRQLKTIELFCGTKSFSKVAKELGHKTWTTDNDEQFLPDLVKDVEDLDIFDPPYRPDIIWASPPCESFSVGSIGKHWNKNHTPKTIEAKIGLEILEDTVRFISGIYNEYWFIENPRGKMRKVIDNILLKYFGDNYKRETVCYCRYGDNRMKPTDIWTNCFKWQPKDRMCHNGNSDHESAPRGSKTGTQGIKNYKDRSRIPSELFKEIFKSL